MWLVFSSPSPHAHFFFFFTPLKLNRCLSNSLKVQWSSVSGNDTSVGMFTGNIPSSLIRHVSSKVQKVTLGTLYIYIYIYKHWVSKVGQLFCLCQWVLINNPSNRCTVSAGPWRARMGQKTNNQNRSLNTNLPRDWEKKIYTTNYDKFPQLDTIQPLNLQFI